MRNFKISMALRKRDEDDGEKLHVTKDIPQEVIDAHIRKRANRLYGEVDAVKCVPDLMEIVVNMPEMADQSFFAKEKLGDRRPPNWKGWQQNHVIYS
jgi:hypothetical protein